MKWTGSFVLFSLLALAGCREISLPNAVGCGMSFTKKSCLDVDGCYWCASNTFASQRSVCVDEVQALHFPTWVYTCSHKASPALEEELVAKPPQTGCDNPRARTEDECLANPECVWCSSGFGPAQEHCMSAEQAKYIPPGIVTCKCKKDDDPAQQGKASKKARSLSAEPEPNPTPNPCKAAVDADSCQAIDGCVWCEKMIKVLKSKCVTASKAQFLPPAIFTCTPAVPTVARTLKQQPAPAPTPAPDPCKDAMDKKSCKAIGGCAWCVNQFDPTLGSLCMDAADSAFIPAAVFNCKAAKKDG